MLDRRMGYKIIKKMTGAKGSVRDAKLCMLPTGAGAKQEMLVTCGCDRFVRIYDPTEPQHLTQVSSIYLKQRLNCMLI